MKKFLFILSFILVCIFLIFLVYGTTQQIKHPDPKVIKQEIPSQPAVKPDINFGKIPLYFISNEGQVHKQAKFYAKASRYTLWLTNKGLVFDSTKRSEVRVKKSEESYKPFQRPNASTPQRQYQRDVSRLIFLGANKNPEISPLNLTKLKVNYFKGNDPSKWVGNIPTSQAVLYKNLYENIDLKVYGIEKQIEYDWIVKPGGNPEDIEFEYKDVKKTKIDIDGNLVITTKFGKLIHKKPVSFQESGELRGREHVRARGREVQTSFKKLKKNTYGFEVGEYDKSKELIIDPFILVYSTYLGGGSNDKGYGIAVDNSGYVYVTGYTKSTDFPTLNHYMIEPGDSYDDVFVSKLDPSQNGASSLLYSTYLGGNAFERGEGLAIDSSGCVYVTGYTGSTDFPILNQYMSDPGDSNYDVFITKLDTSQSGTSSLLYSTYLGGGDKEEVHGIDVDNIGNVYVAGFTTSTDFPTLNEYMSDPGDSNYDAFFTKLDTTEHGTNCLIYSTYLGGADVDLGKGIAIDSYGKAYVTGYTGSTDFPTLNEYMTDPGDISKDAFVTKIDASLSGTASLLYSTYLGGGIMDEGISIAVDNSSNAYVTGHTTSTDFPILNQYQTAQAFHDVFVTQLDTDQSGSSSLIYSTYLGGNDSDFPSSIAVDSNGYVYVTGITESTDFPLENPYQIDQPSEDVFVFKLDTTQTSVNSLIFSTYLGGSGTDYGYGIDVDSSGHVYVAGSTDSTDFPTLNQYMSEPGDGYYDAFVTKIVCDADINPIVLTKSLSSVKAISASINSEVVHEGDSAVTHRGVCWSLSSNPTIWDNYTSDGSGLGEYTSSLTGLTPETAYYVRAYAANDHGLDYGEEKSFTTLPVSITVRAPDGGETWCTGTSQNIEWIPDGVTNTLYIILQQNDVNVALIDKGIDPSLGTYAWTVGDARIGTVLAGVNFKVLLKENGSTIKDKSDAVFTIVDPYVTVITPNGGEDYQIGTIGEITWNTAGLTGTLYIVLQYKGANVALIAKNIDPSLGRYDWTVGDCLQGSVTAGPNHKILIVQKGTTIKDKSDADFVISN